MILIQTHAPAQRHAKSAMTAAAERRTIEPGQSLSQEAVEPQSASNLGSRSTSGMGRFAPGSRERRPSGRKNAPATSEKGGSHLTSYFKRGLRRNQTCLQRLCGLPDLWSVWRNGWMVSQRE